MQLRQHRSVKDSHDENRAIIVNAIEDRVFSGQDAAVRRKVRRGTAKLRRVGNLPATLFESFEIAIALRGAPPVERVGGDSRASRRERGK
jgi:hypothetical protein